MIDHQYILGLVSDSHGEVERTRAAVELLLGEGATAFIFLGDAGERAVLDQFAGRPAWVVLGNCDPPSLGGYAEGIGLTVTHPMGSILVSGRTVTFTHGHMDECVAVAFASGADYLLHGHTHRRRDDRIGGTRVINPGALHRASKFHVAILDVFADDLRSFEVA